MSSESRNPEPAASIGPPGDRPAGEAARDVRRAARKAWPIRRYDLGSEPGDDLSAETTAEERLAMVWPLTVLAWRLAGRSIPGYARGAIPGRLIRSPSPD